MNQSVLNSVQKANSRLQSNLNSMKSFTEQNDYSPYQGNRGFPNQSSPYLTNSPKNINDKIDFINQLYDQLNETKQLPTYIPKQKKNEIYNLLNKVEMKPQITNHEQKSPYIMQRSPKHSVNRSTDTPEQLQPVQPMQQDDQEATHYSKLWTFHNNSREQSQDRTTEVRAFNNNDNEQQLNKTDNPFIKELEDRWSKSTYQVSTASQPYKPHERELMINQMFDDLQGKTSKSSQKKKTNYVESNKKPENMNRRPQYEKVIDTIDRRIQQVISKTPQKPPQRPYQAASKLSSTAQKKQLTNILQPTLRQSINLDNQHQGSQQQLHNLSRSNNNTSTSNNRGQKQDYKKFLEEINMLGEKLCKTSGSLNRTINEIKKREKPKNKY